MTTELPKNEAKPKNGKRRGVVLVAVLVVVVILALAGYHYNDAMTSEYKASEFTHRAIAAQKLADSGIHYAAALLSNPANFDGILGGNPWNNPQLFQAIPVPGDGGRQGYFTIIAPPSPDDFGNVNTPYYGVLDESSKINVNVSMKSDPTGQTLYTALMALTPYLPEMTQQIAYNIVAWMGGSYGLDNSGQGSGYYEGLTPSYRSKNGPIDSIDELLLVQGVSWNLLYGADLNRNGTQENGETDSNSIVAFDRGLSAYLTVHSREQNSDPTTGNPYIFINNTNLQQLSTALAEADISPDLVNFIIMYLQFGPDNGAPKAGATMGTPGSYTPNLTGKVAYPLNSMFDLINVWVTVTATDPTTMKSVSTVYPSPLNNVGAQTQPDMLPALFTYCTLLQTTEIPARININTAPAAVLSTLPGLTANDVQNILSIRPQLSAGAAPNAVFLTPAWLLTEAQLTPAKLQKLDPLVTTRSQVYRVQSVGYFEGKGPAIRVEAVIDTNAGRPRILAWRNMSELGKGWTNTTGPGATPAGNTGTGNNP